jgi:hypothetical protein
MSQSPSLTKKRERNFWIPLRRRSEIIPLYFEEGQRQAIAAVIARALLKLAPSIEKSPEVREMLEKYAASDTAFPYL